MAGKDAKNESDTSQKPAEEEIPLRGKRFDPSEVEKHSQAMLDSVITVAPPAISIFSALGTARWAEVADKNKLGTPRPSTAAVGHDESKRFMYFIPVPEGTPNSFEVRYSEDGRANINLYTMFRGLDRLLPGGYKEVYDLKVAPGVVELDDVSGYGLYVKLFEFTKEPIQELTEEQKTKRKQTREANKAKKNTAAAEFDAVDSDLAEPEDEE